MYNFIKVIFLIKLNFVIAYKAYFVYSTVIKIRVEDIKEFATLLGNLTDSNICFQCKAADFHLYAAFLFLKCQ